MVAAAAELDAEAAVVAGKQLKLKRRWVCAACGGIYYAPINGVCPGCKGPGEEKDVVYDAAGVAKVAE